MRIAKLFILLLLIRISLEANYCIQVLTTNKAELNFIVNEAKNIKYSNFDAVRVERRGNYLVFRVGDYNSYRDALSDVENIRSMKKGAYIRKCDFVIEKALYIKDEEKFKKVVSHAINQSREYVKQEIPKKRYTQKKELTYTYKNNNSSLWGDCKKCFIPVYEEEDASSYKEDIKQLPVVRERKRERRVEVPEPVPTKESFWAKNTHVREVNSKKTKKKSRNRFNIDEQFLP